MHVNPAVRALVLAAAILPPSAASLAAQSDTWALTNARIQTVTRGVIDKGTIIIRKGLIEAVGPAVPVPADARVLDLGGKTVSPGLFDLTSSLGLPAPATPAGGGGPGGGGGGQQQAQAPRQGLDPERMIAKELRLAATDVKPVRDMGITSVLVAPNRGLFRGISALVPTRDDAGEATIIRSQVGEHIGYQGGGGGYPGTLLGVIAYQRQALYDAQRQGAIQDRYKANPRGMERPENDAGLDALVPVVKGQLPAFIDASNEREIRRALNLAEEFKLKGVIVGATEGWQAASALAKYPVVVSVNFPQAASVTGWSYRLSQRRTLNDSAASAREAQRIIEGNAGALHKAGVRFALASGGTREFLPNVRKAVAAGLPASVALEALTIRPAEMVGAGDILGSIEAGKIANLVVTNGDILTDSARVSTVFVDGIRYEVAPPPATRGGPGGGGNAPPAQIGGTWALNLNSPQGPVDITMTVAQDGASFSGSMTSMMGTQEVSEGRINGRNVTWSMSISVGGNTITLNYRGEVEGNRMTGSAEMGSFGSATFTAERRP
jgi:imidazolonepropionase-like amidohydrolase